MITGPFEMSGEGVLDTETGLAIDVPLSRQTWPGWIEAHPDAYARIKAEREKRGLVVDDGFITKPEKPKMRKRTKFPAPRKAMSR